MASNCFFGNVNSDFPVYRRWLGVKGRGPTTFPYGLPQKKYCARTAPGKAP